MCSFHILIHIFIHLLISCAHFIYSFTYSFKYTHSCILIHKYSFTYSFHILIHMFIHVYSFMYTHSCILIHKYSFTYSFTYTHSCVLIHKFIYVLILIFLSLNKSILLRNWNYSNWIIQDKVMAFSCQLVNLPITIGTVRIIHFSGVLTSFLTLGLCTHLKLRC